MKTFKILTLAIIALMSTQVLAQETVEKWSFEFNVDASLATTKPGGTSLNPGAGFELMFQYRFLPHTGIYAGWGWNHFSSDNSFAGKNIAFEETGYLFGMQFTHPIGIDNLSYFVRAGGLFNHIELENNDGDITNDTGHGLGFQVSGGLDIPISKGWNLTPSVKFNYLNRDLKDNGTTMDLNLNYLSARIGFVKNF